MGMFKMFRGYDDDTPKTHVQILQDKIYELEHLNGKEEVVSTSNDNNPNPKNFKILRIKQIRKFVILLVLYPDCKNYEGKKILIYEGSLLPKINKARKLDPHFSSEKNILSPIARFMPNDKGWEYAETFCENI